MGIEISALCKSYGENIIFDKFSISFPDKGVVTLLGPSGCGKTTLLNIIAGIGEGDSGKITGLSGKQISVVFQEDRLLPWADINKNLSLVAKKENMHEINELLKFVELENVGGKYPDELSGGMKRRIAILRALIFRGDIYLLDEPFKGFDLRLKKKIMDYIKELSAKSLVILVTHDENEAGYLSDKIYKLAGKPINLVEVL